MLYLKCKGQVVSIDVDERFADKYINANTVHFEFCERWAGMTITAQFTQNEKTYDVLVDEVTNTVTMPNEITVGEVEISVFGVHPETGVRITTIPVKKKVEKSGFVGDGETPIPPSPDLYAQLIAKVEDAELAQAENIKNAVDAYLTENPVEPGATKEQAEQIEANRKAIEEYVPPVTSVNGMTGDVVIPAGGGAASSVEWSNVVNKPETYPPEAHGHTWNDVTEKPEAYPPSEHTHSYADLEDKPTIPTVPRFLPNPYSLTINGTSYDGSNAVEVTIDAGNDVEIDETLTQGGKAADAKKTGDALNQLSQQMAALQSGVEIVPTVSGSVIALKDASNLPLRGLILHGKTTQDGTPTPDNPVELATAENPTVRVTGKNLWPFGNMTGTAGNNVLDKAEFALPAGSYTIGANVSYPGEKKDWTIGFSDKNGVSITSITFASGNVFTLSRPSATVTLYARCEATFSNIQIEYGRSATGYEPYSGQNLAFPDVTRLPGIPVTSGGNYTDASGQQWICDEIDLERGVKIQRVKTLPLSDVAEWFVDAGTWYNPYYLADAESNDLPIIGLCSHVHRNDGIHLADNLMSHSNLGTFTGIQLRNATTSWGFAGSTPAEFKSFVDSRNIRLVYKCKPEETQLTESELAAYRSMTTNKPNTTIYNDAGCDQTVRYVADTQLYIDNKTSAAMAAQTAALEEAYAEGVASA